MVSKCCICKKKAWCFDDDGKTPYCKECWDKSHQDLSLSEASKPFMDGYEIALKNISPKILEVIEMYFQTHKRYGKSTVETEMRFKDIKADIIKLLNDADHENNGVVSGDEK